MTDCADATAEKRMKENENSIVSEGRRGEYRDGVAREYEYALLVVIVVNVCRILLISGVCDGREWLNW